MFNKNYENMKNSNFCYSCNTGNSCNSCNYCYSCNFCNSCNYCNSCNFCNSCNYCYFSAGLRMSEKMLFCLGERKYELKREGYQKNNQIFNVQVTEEEWDNAINSQPAFILPLTAWVKREEMTDEEKENISGWSEMDGYLKSQSYQDAWKEGWANASQEFKDWVKNLPHFNPELFEKITSIKFESEVKEMTVSEINKALGYDVKIIKERI